MAKGKNCKKCNKYKYLSYFYVKKTGKFGREGNCIVCTKENQLAWRQANKEKIKKSDLKYRQANKEKISFTKKEWAKNNPDKVYLSKKAWRDKNPEKCAEYAVKHRSRRDRIVRQQTPKWVNGMEIKQIYQQCRMISRKTGILHHVDHIIPLQGRDISGLHCPANLQIIPAIDNLKKGNR